MLDLVFLAAFMLPNAILRGAPGVMNAVTRDANLSVNARLSTMSKSEKELKGYRRTLV